MSADLLKRELARFLAAVMFLTRVPVPLLAHDSDMATASARYYPLVGILIGAVAAAGFAGGLAIGGGVVGALLATAATLLLTGAFHEDGLADLFDGMGASSPARALEIMRDSRLGTFGAAALFIVLALKVAALAQLPAALALAALIAVHGLSRLSALIVIATSRYVRSDGTAKPVADSMNMSGLATAALIGIVILTGFALHTSLPLVGALMLGLTAGHILARAAFERRLGGYTGDCLGAVQQISEVGAYLALLAWL
ncbi:adenosylcobinamide-GDP ribazoletransferase [Pacificimonas flava]|uniref:Adenosylcobinamide-GDP ribazoletransferase n=1 Tax=Pacificimonas flava TaxID=1234595 RepID=M2U485_9SPHN|nr:adenosylcobinamide-GDP ribazoletransferase [Pacificimonas flava]EMD82832.1 Cobalamin synthase [Pacificimonas flava]MBB5279447.1 adenosylcobinamide-GDP ribazoletransferase [Pacificimonas flava]